MTKIADKTFSSLGAVSQATDKVQDRAPTQKSAEAMRAKDTKTFVATTTVAFLIESAKPEKGLAGWHFCLLGPKLKRFVVSFAPCAYC